MSEKLQAATSGPNRFKHFNGRASRKEYWAWCGPLIPAVLVLSVFAGVVGMLVSILLFYPTVRRLHDLGRSGWWMAAFNVATNVLAFVAMTFLGDLAPIGALISLVIWIGGLVALGCVPGQPYANDFGPPPRRKGQGDLSETFT